MRKPSWLDKIKWIGFDFDGTLYRLTPAINQKYIEVIINKLASFRHAPPKSIADLFLPLFQKYKSKTIVLQQLGIKDPQIFLGKISQEIKVVDLIDKDARMVELIRKIKQKFPLFLLTNSTRKQLLGISQKIGFNLKTDFDISLSSDEASKSSGEAFQQIIRLTKVKPEEILYIGDNEHRDILTAKAFGMKTAIIYNRSKFADLEINNLEELTSLLGQTGSL